MLNRWIEQDHLLDTLEEAGAGCIAFSPLQQGLLTDRYLGGIPDDSRVRTSVFLNESDLDEHDHGRGCTRSTTSPSAAASRWPSWPWPGRCATRG